MTFSKENDKVDFMSIQTDNLLSLERSNTDFEIQSRNALDEAYREIIVILKKEALSDAIKQTLSMLVSKWNQLSTQNDLIINTYNEREEISSEESKQIAESVAKILRKMNKGYFSIVIEDGDTNNHHETSSVIHIHKRSEKGFQQTQERFRAAEAQMAVIEKQYDILRSHSTVAEALSALKELNRLGVTELIDSHSLQPRTVNPLVSHQIIYIERALENPTSALRDKLLDYVTTMFGLRRKIKILCEIRAEIDDAANHYKDTKNVEFGLTGKKPDIDTIDFNRWKEKIDQIIEKERREKTAHADLLKSILGRNSSS